MENSNQLLLTVFKGRRRAPEEAPREAAKSGPTGGTQREGLWVMAFIEISHEGTGEAGEGTGETGKQI